MIKKELQTSNDMQYKIEKKDENMMIIKQQKLQGKTTTDKQNSYLNSNKKGAVNHFEKKALPLSYFLTISKNRHFLCMYFLRNVW